MTLILRYSDTRRGALTFTGNTLGLSKELNTNNSGIEGSIGAFVNSNTGAQANATWPAGTTFNWQDNTSRAILNLPPGSTVLYAELVWGGNYQTRDQNIVGSINTNVDFTTPLGSFSIAPDPATAMEISAPSGTGAILSFYERSADVTALVQAAGAGTYSAGGIPGLVDPLAASDSRTNHAGWTLAVVYEDLTVPLRNLSLRVGFEPVNPNTTTFVDVPISGFVTPTAGPVTGRILLSAQEGDADIGGDQASFGPNVGSLTPLSGPNNNVNNFFGSQINNDSGNIDTTGTFGTRNATPTTIAGFDPSGMINAGRQGWDITNVDISPLLTNSQTQGVLRLSTAGDAYAPNTVGIQIDVNTPILIPVVKTVDPEFADIGDTLTYTIVFENSGSIDAENVVFTDTIANDTTFVTNSLTINGVVQPGENPQNGVSLGTISGGDITTITFQVTVDTIPSPNPVPNESNLTYNFVGGPGLPRVSESVDSNETQTTVNNATLQLNKSVDKAFADVGETITYTIEIENIGNVTANNVVFSDTIPNDTTYVNNSFTENGVTIGGANPQSGVSLNPIGPGDVTTVTFQVTVDTIPSPNPIPNNADTSWTYTVDPSIPNGSSGRETSNTVNTEVFHAELENASKFVDKDFADCGDTLTYTIVIPNTGNTTAQNVVFTDTIPNDTIFVINSVTVNGITQPGVTPQSGVIVGNIGIGETSTITFQVIVDCN